MPLSDCEVRDPRMRRTRQMLQSALGTLLQTHNFEDISVQDITDAATINRATFYDHYTDKYALFRAMVGGGFHTMLHNRNVCYQGPGSEGPLILALCDFLDEIQRIQKCEAQSAFEPLKDAAIIDVIEKTLLRGMTARDNITAAAASWSMYGAAKEWLKTPDHPPAEKILPVMQAMVRPILAAATQKETATEPALPSR